MHGQKSAQTLRTRSGIANSADVPVGSVHGRSTSGDRNNRLLLLHRKCPNPLVCVRGVTNDSSSLLPVSVPLIDCSPTLCQPMPCKPRLRPVTSHQDAADIHVVGNGMRDTAVAVPSSLSAKECRLRRKVYSDDSRSAAGENPGKQTSSEGNLQGKGHTTDIYIPTASSSLRAKPPSGSKKLRDKVVPDMTGIHENAYYIDVVQCEGRLKMEHVENPRPLPARHYASLNDNNNETMTSARDVHSRPESASNKRCVRDSALHSCGHLTSKRTSNIACRNSCEKHLYTSVLVDSGLPMCSGDYEQTFYRVSAGLKQSPNTVGNGRAVYVDGGTLQRCSSVQHVPRSADQRRRQQLSLKKAISDVDAQISHDGHFYSQVFGDNRRVMPLDDTSECPDGQSFHDKYVTLDSVS